MKNFKWTSVLMGILLAAQFSVNSAYAGSGDSCQKKIERISQQVEELEKALAKIKAELASNDQPISGWKDPDGLIWGKALDRRMNQYEAEKECEKLGLRLPTKEEFERLANRFDRDKRGFLTDKGRADLYAVLPDMKGRLFWSGSVIPNFADFAYFFYGSDGFGVSGSRDFHYYSVRCVGR